MEIVPIDLFLDPQTSGGLVVFIRPEQAEACLDEMKTQGIQVAAIIVEVFLITYRNLFR